MAAANTFTVRIKYMSGRIGWIPNMNMTTQVEALKSHIAVTYFTGTHPRNINVVYDTHNVELGYIGYIELISGRLEDYGINFFDPTTILEVLVGEARNIYEQDSPQVLASLLSTPEYLVDIPANTVVAHAVSPDLNFRKIYILNHPGDQKGLPCTVKYISKPEFLENGTPDDFNKTIIDPDHPEIRLLSTGTLTSSLLHDYITHGRVKVSIPVHGGRKKRTRRTRRRLFKKRTHRKRRNHKRMSR